MTRVGFDWDIVDREAKRLGDACLPYHTRTADLVAHAASHNRRPNSTLYATLAARFGVANYMSAVGLRTDPMVVQAQVRTNPS
jgi:hypothetical protein